MNILTWISVILILEHLSVTTWILYDAYYTRYCNKPWPHINDARGLFDEFESLGCNLPIFHCTCSWLIIIHLFLPVNVWHALVLYTLCCKMEYTLNVYVIYIYVMYIILLMLCVYIVCNKVSSKQWHSCHQRYCWLYKIYMV